MTANSQSGSTRKSEAEYLALPQQEGIRYEYINGEVVAMTGASPNHVTISGNLTVNLVLKLHGKSCKPRDKDLRLLVETIGNYYYPDLIVTCDGVDYVPGQTLATISNPTVIFEVLSPSTEAKDRNIKLLDYARTPSITDYVMISQTDARIDHCTRVAAESNTCNLTMIVGMQSQLVLKSLGVTLTFNEIYEGVPFA